MKVLLRKNVWKLGIIGEIVDVKSGYARNYLVPQGLAILPSENNIRQVEREKAAYLAQVAKERAEVEARAATVNGKEVTISARANEEGHLYGSIGPAQIAAALLEQNVHVDADEIQLDEPIRQLDKYEVTVHFIEDITATIGVWVVPIRELDADGNPIGDTTPGMETATAEDESAGAEEAEEEAPAEE